MVKNISNCTSYFGYGDINNTIHAAICEFSESQLIANKLPSNEDLHDFGLYVAEKFSGNSCYLYMRVYAASQTSTRLVTLKKTGLIDNTECLNITISNAADERIALLAEFPIGAIESVLLYLNSYPFSAVAIISDANDSNKIKEVIALYEHNLMSEVINVGCIVGKAVLTCIYGNDGTTFCCFSVA